ncbi:unnamed protein product [Lactuca virosa]|uniref:Uncharacterized protein n=1 Tax=Lactuca virosa TaxID=75947 RepID=A0AAU9P8Q6_9ASTR|nr:unnamed protein product [Lactuca virosa]
MPIGFEFLVEENNKRQWCRSVALSISLNQFTAMKTFKVAPYGAYFRFGINPRLDVKTLNYLMDIKL